MSHSRRTFLQSAGALAAPAAPQTKARRVHFSPTGAPRKITDNLYLFEDTCQVYVIRDGSTCVLIASPRFAIAADVQCDGKYLGQITEAVVECRASGAESA